MEIPAEVKIPVKEAPTLQTLPPIQMVISPAKKKKTSQS
jgi:hypothetical protein